MKKLQTISYLMQNLEKQNFQEEMQKNLNGLSLMALIQKKNSSYQVA